MGWGTTEHFQKRKKGVGFGSYQPPAETRRPQVVFITTADHARTYFHKVAEAALTFKDVRIVHSDEESTLDEATLREHLEGVAVVVIGTCKRQSIAKDSYSQRIEALAASIARANGSHIVLYSERVHEPVQRHLEEARKSAAVIVVVEDRVTANESGFLELFPMSTQFVQGGEKPEDLARVGKSIAALL